MKLSDMIVSSCNVREMRDDDDISGLQESIKKHHLISKIVLRKGTNGKYEVVAGQRRYQALMNMNGPDYEVPEADVVIRDDLSDEEAFLLSIEENQIRVNLSPMELNKAALKLNQMGKNDKEISEILNVTPYRLKRLFHLGMDKNKIPKEAREELQKPVEKAVFNDAHWEKLRDVDDKDVVKDVVDHIMQKESPPREIPSIVKAIQKQYDAASAASSGDTAVASDDGAPEASDGPIVYEHKGKLVLEEQGDQKILRVLGKGEDEEVPIDQYLQYLRHPEKFECRVTFKLKIKSLD